MKLEYFQMIDSVETLDTDSAVIVARAQVPVESPVFEGHFPGLALVPGVLLIETMAQASGILICALVGFKKMPFLASVKNAKIRTFVLPDSELTIKATREHDGSGFSVTKAEILVEGKTVCNANLTFRFMPFPSPVFENHIRENAIKLGLMLPEEAGAN